MKISDILKELGIPSKEIKIRMAQKRILINGESVSQDLVLGTEIESQIEIGEFIFNLIIEKPHLLKQMQNLKMLGMSVEDMVSCNVKIELTEILSEFIILRFSKQDALVIKTCGFCTLPIN